ncbi:Txe/YoeB family addiction module toxin [Porphyromonas uenonis]|uniref:Txe/YoeB family addiction module toxin n=1 Tax=Porphyromonas uenonis TaxID=281920 RepID=UPI0004727ABE|nr:Txe/YoeB family addiction module toxin [Porphyromonas uenonis]
MFQILFSQRAESDYNFITKNWSQASVRKVINLLAEIEQNPRVGTGKPEQLKHYKDKEIWSRRIDKKNRVIYSIDNDEVLVILISMIGHYAGK